GEIASRGADLVIVTDDNPRSEDPAAIRAEILGGINPTDLTKVTEVDGRRAAIELAVSLATSGDTVLVAGKGHETGQEIAGVVHPFDDRAVLIDLIGQRR
ncbi:MAG TPA: UDP-N-acetylmuramoyl-L-alanyl-D-glutamate--2,6-diaminopimelate ligase, partial [Marmoricola sp.]|nr:UDP-N-acetylmuramoyl-L-alanyl-D-glutamate--2,6-diaminopimelate ligase [Marmoricola sp.]